MSDDLFQRLRRAYTKPDDVIPPGFKTLHQWRAEWGVGKNVAYNLIRRGMEDKIIVRVMFRVNQLMIPHYGEQKKTSSTPRPKRR